jgi:uncharacterized RDD family membrane protein YckC
MGWEEKLKETSESALSYLEGHQQRMLDERAARREARRHRVALLDRMIALMLDLMLIILVFREALIEQSQYTLIFASVLLRVASDPAFTLVHAINLMNNAGLLQVWLVMCLTQFVVIALVLLPCLYFTTATPGMWLMRLRLRQLDRKTRPTLGQYLRFYFAGCVLIPPGMLSFIAMKFRNDGRALHDVVAGVVMLRKRTIDEEGKAALLAADEKAEEALEADQSVQSHSQDKR